MAYIYSFLEEEAKQREIAKGYHNLILAVIERAWDDYKECNEYAMSAWEFLRSFKGNKDLPKPNCKKISHFQSYDHIFLFDVGN